MIFKSASVKGISGERGSMISLQGIFTALLIAPESLKGMFAPKGRKVLLNMLFQFAGSFIIAVALVLPGISASQMLYICWEFTKAH